MRKSREEEAANRLERIQLAIDKGYTANIETGEVYNRKGKLVTGDGYIRIQFRYNGKMIKLFAHQFIYYLATGEVVDCIDHINGLRDDNRISNLRSVTKQENAFNTKAKGYYWCKRTQKWRATIKDAAKPISLGYFVKEEDARQAYLDAKEKHHIIKNPD